jgi:spore coat polysaccharide biosynthesis protein SpsF
MKTVVIIQARMGSTRLPGKVLLPLMGKTVLAHVVERCNAISLVDEVVVATTNQEIDNQIEEETGKLNISCFRGSEADVLQRYYEASQAYHADIIVRVTSDCPLLDSETANLVIKHFLSNPSVDYCSNSMIRSFPRGLDTEVFSASALQRAYYSAKESSEREHVTPYIYLRPHEFNIEHITNDTDYSHYRWTLDTPEDWELIKSVYGHLYSKGKVFGWKEVIHLMETNPEIPLLNAHVEQKKLSE